MDRMKYLMERYKTNDLDTLECRIPFDYKDKKYESLTDDEYINMINKIEKIDNDDIYEVLKERGFIK